MPALNRILPIIETKWEQIKMINRSIRTIILSGRSECVFIVYAHRRSICSRKTVEFEGSGYQDSTIMGKLISGIACAWARAAK